MASRTPTRKTHTAPRRKLGGDAAAAANHAAPQLAQELLARLAIACMSVHATEQHLLAEAAHVAAEALGAPFSLVAEHLPDEGRLLIRAGTGWREGTVGTEMLDADIGSPAGFAMRTEQAVVCANVEDDPVFTIPPLLRRHHVRRIATVVVRGEGAPFGIIQVGRADAGSFAAGQLEFLEMVGAILGAALERRRAERQLHAALEWEKTLRDEMNHRIKNNLQLAATLLLLDAGTTDSKDARSPLQRASSRISAIARVHEKLSTRASHGQQVEARSYMLDLRQALADAGFPCGAEVDGVSGMELPVEVAVPIALIITELVTNAFKHGGEAGIVVTIRSHADTSSLTASVEDSGPGFPADFDVRQTKQLGFRIVRHLVDQLEGALEIERGNGRTEIRLRVPLSGRIRHHPALP